MKPRSAIEAGRFADEHHRKKIGTLGDPLTEIESHIDFAALAAEVDRVAPRPVSPKGGRPPYPTETMVRSLVLKRLYKLSDEQMAYPLLDRMCDKRFCGLANAANIPDRTTVWTFDQPEGRRTAEGGFRKAECGYAAQNRIIDATRTQKHGKSPFGYKRSINVDKQYKIIGRIDTDTASTHDSQHFDKVLDSHNTSRDVYADRGYPSEQRESWLKAYGFRNQIQRKGARNKPLSECQQRRDQRIARTRARVEHPFAAIAQRAAS